MRVRLQGRGCQGEKEDGLHVGWFHPDDALLIMEVRGRGRVRDKCEG